MIHNSVFMLPSPSYAALGHMHRKEICLLIILSEGAFDGLIYFII